MAATPQALTQTVENTEKSLSDFLSVTLPQLDKSSKTCRSISTQFAELYADSDDKSHQENFRKWKERSVYYNNAIDLLSKDPLVAKPSTT